MQIALGKITDAINVISDITTGDKQIPGVMLDLNGSTLKVCYSDGHKATIQDVEVEPEADDHQGQVVVEFALLLRAIQNCQPSGIIKVSKVQFKYLADNIISVMADQNLEETDENGAVVDTKKIAEKKMDLKWKEPGSDLRTSILTRTNYANIFASEVNDTYDRKEFIDDLVRNAVEKGKTVYFSSVNQCAFVSNQSWVTSVPVSQYEVSQEEKDEIRGKLVEAGTFTDESYAKEVAAAEHRIHQSITIRQELAKPLSSILSKFTSDKVYVNKEASNCNIYIDSDTEKFGVWFEMPSAQKTATGALSRYNEMKFGNYQITFIKDFLDNNIKSALNATKSERVQFKFQPSTEDASMLQLVIEGGSASASTADTYRITPSDIVDVANDLSTKAFNISLDAFNQMLSQIKTSYVAVDFNVDADMVCMRVAELDDEKLETVVGKIVADTKQKYAANMADPNYIVELNQLKINARTSVIKTRQFSMLAK